MVFVPGFYLDRSSFYGLGVCFTVQVLEMSRKKSPLAFFRRESRENRERARRCNPCLCCYKETRTALCATDRYGSGRPPEGKESQKTCLNRWNQHVSWTETGSCKISMDKRDIPGSMTYGPGIFFLRANINGLRETSHILFFPVKPQPEWRFSP